MRSCIHGIGIYRRGREGERELDQESNWRRCRVTDEIVNGGYFIALFGVTIFCFFASRVGGMSSRVT